MKASGDTHMRANRQSVQAGFLILIASLMLAFGACTSSDDPAGPAGTSNLVVDLQSLQPSVGALSPSFDPGTQTYEVKVGPKTRTIMLTATVADSRATLKINDQPWPSGQPYGPLSVQPGRNPNIPLLVEALGLSKEYAVVVTVETTPELQNLVASAGPLVPTFDPKTTAYTVTTDTNTATTTITATLIDDTATLTINGLAAASGQPSAAIPLAYGQTVIPVEARTTDGKTATYQVTVNRPPPNCSTTLTNLTVSQGTLNFNPSTQNYVVPVGSGVGSLTVTATAHPNATVKINGQVTTTAQVPLNPAGQSTSITITVDCPGQPTMTYTIRVDREAPCNSNLTTLTVNQGQLSPVFSPSVQDYTVRVGSGISSITVTASAATAVSINGQITNTLTVPLNSAGQKTTITIVVQCPDGTNKTYTIVVDRDPPCSTNLTNLTLDGGKIPLEFNSSTLDYAVTVGSTVSSLTVAATKQDANATVQIDGQFTNSLNVSLGAPGSSKTIQVVVGCADGSSKTYRVTVTRQKGNANLKDLKIGSPYYPPCTLASTYPLMVNGTPTAFQPTVTDYTVTVPSSTGTVRVVATKDDANQTVAINQVPTTSGCRDITLNAAGTSTVIKVEVTASDGVTKQPYTVTVNRSTSNNNFLSNLLLQEDGASSPVKFDTPFSGRTDFFYVATDCCGTIKYRLTATAEDSTATLRYRVNTGAFQSLSSGVASSLITFSCCQPNTITVEVTAQNGQPRNYTISFTIVD